MSVRSRLLTLMAVLLVSGLLAGSAFFIYKFSFAAPSIATASASDSSHPATFRGILSALGVNPAKAVNPTSSNKEATQATAPSEAKPAKNSTLVAANISSGDASSANAAPGISITTLYAVVRAVVDADIISLLSNSNLREITLDPAIGPELVKQLQSQGMNDATVRLYVSEQQDEKVIGDANNTLLSANYKFGLPGVPIYKPTRVGGTLTGIYSQTNLPDVLIASRDTRDLASLPSYFLVPGLNQDISKKIAAQLKGHKTIFFVLVAPNLAKSLLTLHQPDNSVSPGVNTPQPVPVSQDLPVYPGSRLVDTTIPLSTNGSILVHRLSNADYRKIVAWAKEAFAAKGWTEVNLVENGGATIITAKKGNYALLGTIAGPLARGSVSFDNLFKQDKAGPNDTVIALTVKLVA